MAADTWLDRMRRRNNPPRRCCEDCQMVLVTYPERLCLLCEGDRQVKKQRAEAADELVAATISEDRKAGACSLCGRSYEAKGGE